MALDDFVKDDNDDEERDTTIEDVTLPVGMWRYFISQSDGYFPRYSAEHLSEDEIRAIIDFIDEELESSLPFAWEEDDERLDKIRLSKEKLEEKL